MPQFKTGLNLDLRVHMLPKLACTIYVTHRFSLKMKYKKRVLLSIANLTYISILSMILIKNKTFYS